MFWKLDVFHGGARVGLGFEVVISELENYTIISVSYTHLRAHETQIKMNVGEYIINDYLKRILKCEI